MTVSLVPVSHSFGGPIRAGDEHSGLHRHAVGIRLQLLPVDDLELHQVNMDGMGVGGEVIDLPDLGGTQVRVLGDGVHELQRYREAIGIKSTQHGLGGAKGTAARSVLSMILPFLSVVTKTVVDSSSLRLTWRTLFSGPRRGA